MGEWEAIVKYLPFTKDLDSPYLESLLSFYWLLTLQKSISHEGVKTNINTHEIMDFSK